VAFGFDNDFYIYCSKNFSEYFRKYKYNIKDNYLILEYSPDKIINLQILELSHTRLKVKNNNGCNGFFVRYVPYDYYITKYFP
jgi:hypothetical protein